MSGLQKQISSPRRFLVYTSAGNQSNLHEWVSPRRSYDVWATYYGDGPHPHLSSVDYANQRKGAKFPNLRHVFQTWPELIEPYEAVLVLDDDIRIGAQQIDKLFALREKYDLWLMQPAFDYRGKISHKPTGWQPDYQLRYSNFVELNVPLFRRDILKLFLTQYDERLVGYGIDWWYCHLLQKLGAADEKRIAIVDSIRCTNPHDHAKKDGIREIDTVQPLSMRRQTWLTMRRELEIDIAEKIVIEGGIRLPLYKSVVNRLLWRRNKKAGKRLKRQQPS